MSSSHAHDLVTKDLRARVAFLAERKLSGQKLKDAKGFIVRARSRKPLENLVARLELLPDKDGENSNLIYGPEARARIRAARASGMTIAEVCRRWSISHETLYRIMNREEKP